jgi:trimeric autotransporter adhesin
LESKRSVGFPEQYQTVPKYPYPVRGTTSISYFIPEGAGRALMVITDALGRTIKIVQLSGSGTVNLDASILAAGVYNYSLIVDNKTVTTRKMTVIK